MNAQKTKKATYNKALLALVATFSCFLIYVLACVRSPVSWSPDYSKIAILVTPPGDDPNKFAIFTYDIATGKRLLLDEVEKDGFLCAPSWSPDGKWVAYYRVEPTGQTVKSPSEGDPNAGAPESVPTAAITTKKTDQPNSPTAAVEKLFSEENKMLPPFMFEIVKEKLDEEDKDRETFDVKLMLARPDGTERRVLRVIESEGDENHRKMLMLMRPEWTKDCKHLFYDRMIGSSDFCYIGSLEIDTGKMYAHLLDQSSNQAAVSPDGSWVVSLSEAGEEVMLTVARVDGNFHKYVRLALNLHEGPPAYPAVAWFPDAKHLLISAKEGFRIMDADTGSIEEHRDPNAGDIAYPVFSATGNTLYYLAVCEANEPNGPEKLISLKSMNLKDKAIKTVFALSDVPDLDNEKSIFSISPDGKRVIMRTEIKSAGEEDRSALLFWDGKTRKVVETDRWIEKPLYGNENLVFEKKLIGKWKAKDSEILISKGTQKKTYRIISREKDSKEERHFGANLVSVKGMMFLGMFFDESLLKKDLYGSQFLPNFFVKVDQIEPKLLLRRMYHEEVAEMLKKDPNSLKQETAQAENVLEFERISARP
jgi:WD40 repeat protein